MATIPDLVDLGLLLLLVIRGHRARHIPGDPNERWPTTQRAAWEAVNKTQQIEGQGHHG